MDTSSTTVATTTDNPLTTLRRGHSSPRSRRSLETPRRRITFAETDDSSARSKESTTPPAQELEDVSLEPPRAEAEPHEYPRSPRDFRERTLDRFYLHDNGDRETVRLLMRGMPIPCTYGLPNTDGSILSNAREFTYLFHPLVSVFKVHPLCPFTAKERFVVFFCSVAFNFVWTAFMEYHRGKISVLFGGGRSGDERGAMFYLVKNIVTTLYAVLIRQIVICPCLYGPLIQAACEGDAPVGLWNGVGKPSTTIHKIDDRKLARRAQRVKRWKLRGDRGIMWLLVVHFAVVFTAIFLLASHLEGAPYLGEREKNTPQRHHAALLIFYSEVINFWFWFVKFTPLFISASLGCLHAVDATRVHQTRSWVVFLSILSRFGPRRGHRRGASERERARSRRWRLDETASPRRRRHDHARGSASWGGTDGVRATQVLGAVSDTSRPVVPGRFVS